MSKKQYEAVLVDPKNPADDPRASLPIEAPDNDVANAAALECMGVSGLS
jgi:hypothetical protein